MDIFIEDLVKEFSLKIPTDEIEREELITAFKKYLQIGVNTIQNSDSKFIKKDSDSIKEFLSFETKTISDMDITAIKQFLINDNSFLEIKKFSEEIFELSKRKIQKENIIVKYDIDAEIKKMEKLLDSVKTYNQEKARKLMSETILDLNFLMDTNAGFYSFRLYHYKNKNCEIKEER